MKAKAKAKRLCLEIVGQEKTCWIESIWFVLVLDYAEIQVKFKFYP